MALPKTILVTGATGKQGSAVAQELLKKGQKVRALTRKPETAAALVKAGASVVRGDFNDRASIEAAMAGCQGVFAMSTPFEAGMEAEVQQGWLLAEVAKAADIRHFVYTSVGSADRSTGIPHFETKYRVEQHIKKLGLPHTILRPVFFMENFGTWLLPGIRKGSLAAPLWPQTRLHMISLRDIGEFAAAAFLHPELFLGREITLAGDVLTFPQVAEMLSKALGHAVYFKRIPDDQAEKAVGPDMALMYRWFNQVGYDVDIHALEQTYGMRMTKFSEVLANEEWAKPPLVGGRS
ncbi:MAG: NmrA/HSCARG family protein [Elusimicrobia bacterium]|nr:NmrA/HSCARG family protein [Elusimicrobiota bacterium]